MAFGFPASYVTTLDLIGDRATARAGLVYALNTLGWKYTQTDLDHYRASVSMSGLSWGETLSVSIIEHRVFIRSSCIFPLQLFDWGKNGQNVRAFLAHYHPKEARDLMLNSTEPAYVDKAGDTPLGRLIKDTNDV